MEEMEYFELQNLLLKYKINCLKTYSNTDISAKYRERVIKQVRYIDYIRKGMSCIVKSAGE